VIALATSRIEELSTRKRGVTQAIDAIRTEHPAGSDPQEIPEMLDAVPDLRPALQTATAQELAEIFGAVDITVTYDTSSRRLNVTATITPALLPDPNEDGRPEERSRMFDIAGAGFSLTGNRSASVERVFPWPTA
jgi:hypothetical protein